MKRRLVIFIMLIVLMITSTVIGAFLTSDGKKEDDLSVGFVDVEVYAYFQRNNSEDPLDFYEVDMSTSSSGVVTLDITDISELMHFDNFKVKIKIYSNVYTYFRVAVYEQFTLTYTVGDSTTVIATTRDTYAPFNFHADFYDNRNQDGFFYYKNQVRRINETTPLELDFIQQALVSHDEYPSRYTLQIGFIIEAVQFYNGPQINWGLENPPWNLSIDW